jgi:DNA helicase HerA-like ATPase
MKATKNTRSLKDVLRNIQALKVKAHGLSESVYSVLEQYLIEIIPQIDRFKFLKTLNISDGINVMDLSEMTLEMRLLVIRSVMEQVINKMHSIIVIIPEAWEAIPQGRNTPVKLYAEIFIRKGASIGNYLFIDSQDIAGIDKTPLRQCNNWIMGRQRETHEVERSAKS